MSAGRGFLLGCTAGRTTLNGEGLQHQDGHSLLLASTVPERRRLRPRLLLRGGDHHRGRDPADDRARSRRTGTGTYPLQRELPDARPPLRPRGGRTDTTRAPSRACTDSPPTTPIRPIGRMRRTAVAGDGGRGHHPLLGVGLAGGHRGPAAAGRRLGRGRRPVVGDLVQVAAGRRHVGRSAGTASIPDDTGGCPSSPSNWPLGRADRGGQRFHAGGSRPGRTLDAAALHLAGHRRIRAIRHPGASSAGSSRWMPPTWWWPSSVPWRRGRSGPGAVTEAIDRYGIDSASPDPWAI